MDIQILAQQFYEHSLHFKGYSKETIRRYKYVIDFYCRQMGIKTIAEVSQDNVRALILHGRAERNWSPNTTIVFHKSLLVFFRWCTAKGYLKANPVIDIEKPRVEQKLPTKFNRADSQRLLEIVYNYPYESRFLRYRNHAIFATFMFAGLRKNELLHLLFADVDLEAMTIFVRQGKGRKDRMVPISHTLAESLRRYLDERKKAHILCPGFFASSTTNQAFTEHGLKHLVRTIRAASGLKFSVHKLRHTFATLMLEGGCDIYSLSRMMGHSDIKTTTIYLYASAEHLRGQMMKHPLNETVPVY